MVQQEKTIRECLSVFGEIDFTDCTSITEEFNKIKRVYFKLVLQSHPDKGGDPAVFRSVNEAFEIIREIKDKGVIDSFAAQLASKKKHKFTKPKEPSVPMPSYEYYEFAEQEDVPPYRFETAKSGRSNCFRKATKRKEVPHGEDASIAKGELRCGSIIEDVGSYGRWHHVGCWRVPSRLWLGLPLDATGDRKSLFEAYDAAMCRMEGIIFVGYTSLSPEHREQLIEHVMNKEHHAKYVKRSRYLGNINKPRITEGAAPSLSKSSNSNGTGLVPASAADDSNVVRTARKFLIPQPGVGGAVANALAGKTVVITGTFPELGGGAGLELGKAKAKAMLEAFGAKVTSAVSGRTDILLVGHEPGASKVAKGKAREDTCQLIDLHGLERVLYGHRLEDMEPPSITNYSHGYRGRVRKDLITYLQNEDIDPQALKTLAQPRPREELIPPKPAKVTDAKKPKAKKMKKPKTEKLAASEAAVKEEHVAPAPRKRTAKVAAVTNVEPSAKRTRTRGAVKLEQDETAAAAAAAASNVKVGVKQEI